MEFCTIDSGDIANSLLSCLSSLGGGSAAASGNGDQSAGNNIPAHDEVAMGVEPMQLNQDSVCDSSDYILYRVMEFGIKSLPSMIFFVLGGMRYWRIRDIGQGRVIYSLHFKFKFIISGLMGFAYILYLFIVWGQKPSATHSSWVNICQDDQLVVFYGIQGCAWLFSCFLMVFEYQRRLSEEWYANQLFWCLNFIIEVITFLVLIGSYGKDAIMVTLAVFNMVGNLILIVLMVKTERRTMVNLRPEASDNLHGLLLSTEQPRRRSGAIDNDGPFLRVKFYDKVIQGREGINLFQFRVSVHGDKQTEIKLLKKYSEFQHLQDLVNDQALKQSDLFNDGSLLNEVTANRSYKLPSDFHQVPKLEDPATASSQLSENSRLTQQNSDSVVNFIKNLERFCNEVADNKLFWTPEVIGFFGVTNETLKREYEFAREDIQRQLQSKIDGQLLGSAHYRRQSYVNLERPLLDSGSQIQEEFASGDSGSTKNSKKKNLFEREQAQLLQQPLAATFDQQSMLRTNEVAEPLALSMYSEDDQVQFHEELRRNQYPISIKFLMWQDSNIGNYIEFKIQVTYHEGNEIAGQRQSLISPHNSSNQNNAAAQQGTNQWTVYKRYSNFVDLHEILVPFFKAEGLQVPPLPPKIANDATSQRNLALTQRKGQLQAYLRQVLLLVTERAPVPLLQFLSLHEQPYLGFYSLETVARMSAVNLRQLVSFDIVSNKITFVNNSPKVFYKVVLKYHSHFPLPAQQHSAPREEEVVTYKQFSDFKQLDLIIKLTCYRMGEYGAYMPILPQKRYPMSGNKKSGDELQSELVEYVNDLLRIQQLQRMFYLRLFLCINAYPEITEDTFNDAPSDDLTGQTDVYQVQNHHETHTGLLRESSDISNLVQFSNRPQFATTTAQEDDHIAFDSESSAMISSNQHQQSSNLPSISGIEGSMTQGMASSQVITEDDEDDPFSLAD